MTMRYSLKVVYTDVVKPTTLVEIDCSNPQEAKENLLKLLETQLDKLVNCEDTLIGIYLSKLN